MRRALLGFLLVAAVLAACRGVPRLLQSLTAWPLSARPDYTHTWGLIATSQLVMWCFALYVLSDDIRASLRGPRRGWVHACCYAVFMFAVMVAISIVPLYDGTLMPEAWRLCFFCILGERMVHAMTFFVVLGSGVGALIIGVVGRQFFELDGKKTFKDLVTILGRLRRSFSALAILLTIAVFSTSRLYAPISGFGSGAPKQALTQGIVLNYGLFLSFLLVIGYLPVALRYQQVAAELVDTECAVGSAFNKEQVEKRHEMQQTLGLTALSGVEWLIGALGPALSALLSFSKG